MRVGRPIQDGRRVHEQPCVALPPCRPLSALADEAAALPPHSVDSAASAPLVLSWFNGARSPHNNALVQGVAAGLSLQCGGAELYRAVCDGQRDSAYSAATLSSGRHCSLEPVATLLGACSSPRAIVAVVFITQDWRVK